MGMTRRDFLLAASAMSLLPAGAAAQPRGAPLARGPYRVGRALLGVTPATAQPAMPAAVEISHRPGNAIHCANGMLSAERPGRIAAALHYPAREDSTDVERPIADWIDRSRRHPLVLYAHAKRRWLTCPEHVPPGLDSSLSDPGQDFRRAERLLSHIASHGFVVAAPDLGWLVETFEEGDWDGVGGLPRARILVALHAALAEHAGGWFGGALDLGRIALVGHSTGAAACLAANERLKGVRALGLIAPGVDDALRPKARRSPATLVIASSLDLQLARDPALVYREARRPKLMVRLEGANHLGFTELCTDDNRACIDGEPPASIARAVQQDVAASYLAVFLRHYLAGERSMRRYLAGKPALGTPVTVTAEL